ncbi:lipoate--protein ligase family protein [Acaricomes phytoseiuli]|uniref:lipoate--protein ligase family protein n=1 Tax=Acaricomes phytoseiuli TaxID=291968 RepID=UPI000374195F|nr:biotin/lipoate A/B protein ligase family protein [Acaricomes phytoseiuli]
MTGSQRQGQYKVPGGKLVVADLRVDGDALSDISINGDFFLEPDAALADINTALIGLPASTSAAELASAIRAGLRPEATLFGFSPEAVAIAVRRALGKATTWEDHEFDVIEPVSLSALQHAALDEVITRQVGAGERRPTLRFWEWQAPSVVIGSFQSLRNEVDAEAAERFGVTTVRRMSGGGAMFMEPGNAITYSLSVPQTLVNGMSFAESYPFLDAWVMESLERLGIKANYVPLNDIASEQGKIGGAAQKRLSNGGLLHHVTMSYDMDADKLTQVLRIGRKKLSDKGIVSAKKRVDPLRSQTGQSREDIMSTMISTFESRYVTHRAELSAEDIAVADGLIDTKFGTAEWTARVP